MGSRPDWATARVQGRLRLQGKALKTRDRTKASKHKESEEGNEGERKAEREGEKKANKCIRIR